MDLSYAAGFRGPGILIKRSTIVDIPVYAAWLRGPDISQNIKEILKKYPEIDYRAFAFSRRHYAADNRTVRDIHNFGPFWVVKIKGGAMPPPPGVAERKKKVGGLTLPLNDCTEAGVQGLHSEEFFCPLASEKVVGLSPPTSQSGGAKAPSAPPAPPPLPPPP